jgi:hypothetical protein
MLIATPTIQGPLPRHPRAAPGAVITTPAATSNLRLTIETEDGHLDDCVFFL